MLQSELYRIEGALFGRFGAKVHIYNDASPEHIYIATSEAFADRRGVRLLISRPYRNRIVARTDFDVFATHLIDVWNTMSDETVAVALDYLYWHCSILSVELRIGGIKLTNDMESVKRIKSVVSPADVSLRVAKEIRSEITSQDLLDIVSCAYGFLFIISGVLVDSTENNSDIWHHEGQIHQTTVNRHERSRVNRAVCIAAHGAVCAVCGMDFGKVYGPFAAGFIEVHHRSPVSMMSCKSRVNPITDLIPLCPNCHAVVHMENPPIEPERLRQLIIDGKAVNENESSDPRTSTKRGKGD